MRKGVFVWALAVLLVLISVAAAPPVTQVPGDSTTLSIAYPKRSTYALDTNVTLHYHVYNGTGYIMDNVSTLCYIHMYDATGAHSFKRKLAFDPEVGGGDFETYFDLTNVTGLRSYIVWCNGTSGAGFVSSAIEITADGMDDDPDAFVAAIILVPLVFGILLIFAAMSAKAHPVLQAFLMMLAAATVLSSMYLGMVAVIKFYHWPAMQEAIGSTTWWLAMSLFAIIVYWLIYLVASMLHTAAQKRQEKIEY